MRFFKPSRHPKWKEASITAAVPGWQRFKAAHEWLKNWQGLSGTVRSDLQHKSKQLARFQKILASHLTPAQRDFIERRVVEEQAALRKLAESVALETINPR